MCHELFRRREQGSKRVGALYSRSQASEGGQINSSNWIILRCVRKDRSW